MFYVSYIEWVCFCVHVLLGRQFVGKKSTVTEKATYWISLNKLVKLFLSLKFLQNISKIISLPVVAVQMK